MLPSFSIETKIAILMSKTQPLVKQQTREVAVVWAAQITIRVRKVAVIIMWAMRAVIPLLRLFRPLVAVPMAIPLPLRDPLLVVL